MTTIALKDASGATVYVQVVSGAGSLGDPYIIGHQVTNFPSTQPVSAASLPLPSGASTSGNQTAANTSLSSIDGKVATEATLALIKTDTDKIPASPAQEHVIAGSPHATRLTDGTSFYKPTTPADTQPISATALPLPTGAATEATLATLSTSANQGTLNTNIGATNESAAATDTSTSGINGLLKRMLQRITTLIAVFPSAPTGSGNFKIALSESTATVTVSQSGTVATQDIAYATGQITNVSAGTTATLLPASALSNRKLVRVTNQANPFGYPALVTIGYSSGVTAGPTAAAGTGGWQLQPGQSRDFVVAAGQALYGITTTQALVVQVEEFA
jgi:hypothetical protein